MSAQEPFLKFINRAYGFFDQHDLSVSGLLVVGTILALAFLFAVREAAGWFFKIHDLKREIRALQTLVSYLNDRHLNESRDPEPLPTANSKPAPSGASFPIIH